MARVSLGWILVTVLGIAAPAQLKEGSSAPALKIERFLNTKVRSLAEFKGRLRLDVYINTKEPACRSAVEHLNLLHDRFSRKGLAVILVSKEDPQALLDFARETILRAPIAIEPGLKSYDLYGFESFPSAAAVNPDGKIGWIGHPLSFTSTEASMRLRVVKSPVPLDQKLGLKLALPKAHAAIAKLAADGSLGEAHAALAAAEGAKDASEEDVMYFVEARKAVEALLEFETACAERADETKRLREAEKLWNRIAVHFGGMRGTDRAKERSEELAKDPKATLEREAEARFTHAQALAKEGKTAQAQKILDEILGGPLKDTEAARGAAALKEQLARKRNG